LEGNKKKSLAGIKEKGSSAAGPLVVFGVSAHRMVALALSRAEVERLPGFLEENESSANGNVIAAKNAFDHILKRPFKSRL